MKVIFSALEPALTQDPRFKLSLMEQFVLTLMKLRLNLCRKDLAYRFNISKTTVTNYIEKFINIMHVRLPAALLVWPDREALVKTMPLSFRTNYPNCITILDCFEVRCDICSNIVDKASCYSSYKACHICKYLIGMSPQGAINFASKGYGGRISDVQIVKESGLLDLIESGDVVMADRGFLIEEEITSRNAEFVCTAFKGRREQLGRAETEQSRIIAN